MLFSLPTNSNPKIEMWNILNVSPLFSLKIVCPLRFPVPYWPAEINKVEIRDTLFAFYRSNFDVIEEVLSCLLSNMVIIKGLLAT